jgi:hypothetical protein
MMNSYRQELLAIREGVGRPPARPSDTNGRIKCRIPLTEQIEALMRSLPPKQRDRPWSMDELVVRLQGRYNTRPSAGSVGLALRHLGWTRARDWSTSGGGRRVWHKR